jgi:hypothetical protein
VAYTTGYPNFFKAKKNILTLSYVRKYFLKNIYAYKRGEIWFENAWYKSKHELKHSGIKKKVKKKPKRDH